MATLSSFPSLALSPLCIRVLCGHVQVVCAQKRLNINGFGFRSSTFGLRAASFTLPLSVAYRMLPFPFIAIASCPFLSSRRRSFFSRLPPRITRSFRPPSQPATRHAIHTRSRIGYFVREFRATLRNFEQPPSFSTDAISLASFLFLFSLRYLRATTLSLLLSCLSVAPVVLSAPRRVGLKRRRRVQYFCDDKSQRTVLQGPRMRDAL